VRERNNIMVLLKIVAILVFVTFAAKLIIPRTIIPSRQMAGPEF